MELHVNTNEDVVTRVGGNPESTLRFQTHVMSNLVHDQFNDADGFDENLESAHTV